MTAELLIYESMVLNYIHENKTVNEIPTLRRTRASTKKFVESHKIELAKVELKGEIIIARCKFNDIKMEVKVYDEKITEVKCECKEFCFHRELLLKHLTFKDDNPEPIIELKRKRLATSVGRQPTKRLKLNDENDSKAVNVQSVDDKIKLVKKKKIVELSQEDLEKVSKLKMENLIKSFGRGSFDDFQKHCFNIMSENKELLKLADELTVEQANTEIWHQLRIGRITASRLYETSRCTMARGSLVDTFMGKRSGFSFAMMRGTILEEFVFLECQKEFPTLKHAGLVMNHEANPFYAASPDGICDDFVLEIKCPANANTHAQYIDIEKLSKKYFAQIQLQMFVTGRKKALLAVAALDFETTRGITKIWIPFDKVYIDDMIEQSIEFYEKCVFPALKRKFLR